MSASTKRADMSSGLSKLTLGTGSTPPQKAAKAKPKSKEAVADSWEDEDASSDSDSTVGAGDVGGKEGTSAPPPTPISPTYRTTGPFSSSIEEPASPTAARQPVNDFGPSRRPEKTDAVARRMIASALGVKVPKLTEEQKAYDKAIREQEKKRKDAERAAEKERQAQAEKAKAAIWGD
jgi:hypothetical protein